MQAVGVDGACALLGCKRDKLQELINKGLPVFHEGKEQRFIDIDVIDFMRKNYTSTKTDKSWRSRKEAKSGTLTSRSQGSQELGDLLAPETRN